MTTATETTTEPATADQLQATIAGDCATLAAATTELEAVEEEMRRRTKAASKVVREAQEVLDAHRRDLLRAHADTWRQRAAQLREEIETTPWDETVVHAEHKEGFAPTPVLVFRTELLARQAKGADERAETLERQAREPSEKHAEAGLLRPEKTWLDGVFGDDLDAAVEASLDVLAQVPFE